MTISIKANPDGSGSVLTNQSVAITFNSAGSTALPNTTSLTIGGKVTASSLTVSGVAEVAELSSPTFAGMIGHFAMNTAPIGWLAANGAAVSRATYPILFSRIGTIYGVGDGTTTFNLPDLRGEFIRGVDAGRGVDTGRVFGSFQAVQTNNIGAFQTTAVAPGASPPRELIPDDAGTYTAYTETGQNDDGNGTGLRIRHKGVETRPRNVALLACIKY